MMIFLQRLSFSSQPNTLLRMGVRGRLRALKERFFGIPVREFVRRYRNLHGDVELLDRAFSLLEEGKERVGDLTIDPRELYGIKLNVDQKAVVSYFQKHGLFWKNEEEYYLLKRKVDRVSKLLGDEKVNPEELRREVEDLMVRLIGFSLLAKERLDSWHKRVAKKR